MTDLPKSQTCPIGPLALHTFNYEKTECIWCGPSGMAWKPGRWIDIGDGQSAWSIEPKTWKEKLG